MENNQKFMELSSKLNEYELKFNKYAFSSKLFDYQDFFEVSKFTIPEFDKQRWKYLPNDFYQVAYITDKNYLIPTIVGAFSSKVNNPDLNINILCINVKEDIINYYKSHLPFFNFITKDLPSDFLRFYKKEHYVTPVALLKVYLGEIFHNYNSILYLDSDTLVVDSIKDIFLTFLGSNYAGVVKDYLAEIRQYHKIISTCNYFNSGVMFLNLELMRKNNLHIELMKTKENLIHKFKDKLSLMDQDALNICFANKVIYLPPAYNLMAYNNIMFTDKIGEIAKIENCSELKIIESFLHPKIIHYSTLKPWNDFRTLYFNIWHQYYELLNNEFFNDNRF